MPFTGVPRIYSLLADIQRPVCLLEVPFYPADRVFENGEYVLNSTAHWRPLLNGYSGVTPDSYRARADALWIFPAGFAIEAMTAAGVTHVMVHLERLSGPEGRELEQSLQGRPDFRLAATDRNGHRLYEFTPFPARGVRVF
jgi:hypothetical protein